MQLIDNNLKMHQNVILKILKWVAVFQCDVPHQWLAQRQGGPVCVYCDGLGCHVLCLYTVMGWSVMSCVCGMAFLCGSTLVNVPLLQAGTIAMWPQMFKSDVKPGLFLSILGKCHFFSIGKLSAKWSSIGKIIDKIYP